MGINYKTAWLLASLSLDDSPIEKVDFTKTLTLGRQSFTLSQKECHILSRRYFSSKICRDKYSEKYFHLLARSRGSRAGYVDSLDYSDYEGATIIHDLTTPISNDLKGLYTCVFDGGLLEHIWNYPIALRNAMDMIATNGHLIMVTPGNNMFGHGFYQFSPELFYSILSKKNGFTDTKVYLCNHNYQWFLVKNPRIIHSRTEVSPKWSNALLYIVSRKVGIVPDSIQAYQSDYEEIWAQNESGTLSQNTQSVAEKIHNNLPTAMRGIVRKLYESLTYNRLFKEKFTRIWL